MASPPPKFPTRDYSRLRDNWTQGVRCQFTATKFQVVAPYRVAFLKAAHELGGYWRARSKMWSFKRDAYPMVARQLNLIYGTQLPSDPAEYEREAR